MPDHPRYVEMVTEAVDAIGGTVDNKQIREYITKKYSKAGFRPNTTTINCTILLLSVNVQSRTNYPEAQKPRTANHPLYDTLFSVERGKVVRYNPDKHGIWAIELQDGKAVVKQVAPGTEAPLLSTPQTPAGTTNASLSASPAIRFLCARPSALEPGLVILQTCVETPLGTIDLLAEDSTGAIVVVQAIEMDDAGAGGQVLALMGWTKQNLANADREVRGVILMHEETDTAMVRWACGGNSRISMYQWDLSFSLLYNRRDVQ